LVSATVQVEEPPGVRLAGEQLSDDSAAGAVRFSEKVREPPLSEAVMVAAASAATVAAVAVNPPEVDPAATVTEAGTLSEALLSERATETPPAGAAALSVTVHELVPGVAIDPGVQVRPLKVATGCKTVTTPLAADIVICWPSAVAARGFVSATMLTGLGVSGEIVRVNVATTPLGTAFVLNPVTRQVLDPRFALHVTDFPAALATGPLVTTRPVKSIAEKLMVHCSPAA
jgi:hypothetical protein